MDYQYSIIDVFTQKQFYGAQIAVFTAADGLSDKDMQLIARELNLSETVFMFKQINSASSVRLRIFSPQEELDFVGHPMIACGFVLGSAKSFVHKKGSTDVVFEQNSGKYVVTINYENNAVSSVQFSMKPDAVVDRYVPSEQQLAAMLKVAESDIEKLNYRSLLVACGQNYLIVPMRSFEAVRNAIFDQSDWAKTIAPICMADQILLFSNQSENPSSTFHGRLLGPTIGVNEDPPIGSAMPAFTSYLCHHQQVVYGTHAFVIDRGLSKVRKSVLNIEMNYKSEADLTIRIGGPAVRVGHGVIKMPS